MTPACTNIFCLAEENPLTRKPTRIELQELVVGSSLLLIPQYEHICRLLGVKSSEISMAKKDHPNENKMAFLKCLHIWLDGLTQVAVTWETLFGVLEKAGYQEHVRKVKRELLFEGTVRVMYTSGMYVLYVRSLRGRMYLLEFVLYRL